MLALTEIITAANAQRFTRDGSRALETRLSLLCERIRTAVDSLLPAGRLEGLVLAGGYGRGEGGVLRTSEGERPYNDLEFYVFLRGPRLLNERRFGHHFEELGARLSPTAGVQVEFKLDSLPRLRRSPVSMFAYDMVSGHRIIQGRPDLFKGCEHHLEAERIPVAEATRLLFNRCTGLLLAKELLTRGGLTEEEHDFIGRNIAKAQLALGDALLTARGQYHWSCVERGRRVAALPASPEWPWLAAVQEHHQHGVEFKLHPSRSSSNELFHQQHAALSNLAAEVWVWIESRHFNRRFASAADYALSPINKCPGTPAWRNLLLNVRTFGLRAAFVREACRYPRHRLLSTLPLLLWNPELPAGKELLRHAQQQLQTRAEDWSGLVNAYKRVWRSYG